jgi:hypothetical protein
MMSLSRSDAMHTPRLKAYMQCTRTFNVLQSLDLLWLLIIYRAPLDAEGAHYLLGQHALGSYGLVMPFPLAQLADSPVWKHVSSSTPASACFRPLYMMTCGRVVSTSFALQLRKVIAIKRCGSAAPHQAAVAPRQTVAINYTARCAMISLSSACALYSNDHEAHHSLHENCVICKLILYVSIRVV